MVDISANELLDYTLQTLEGDLYPKLRQRLEQLLNLFNSEACKRKIKRMGDEFVSRIRGALHKKSVVDLMICLRVLLAGEEFEELMILLNILSSPISQCIHGLAGSFSTTKFKTVLDDKTLSDDERIRRLFKILKDVSGNKEKDYEKPEYKAIKGEYGNVINDLDEGNETLQLGKLQFVKEITDHFEPLREKLVNGAATAKTAEAAGNATAAVSVPISPSLNPLCARQF